MHYVTVSKAGNKTAQEYYPVGRKSRTEISIIIQGKKYQGLYIPGRCPEDYCISDYFHWYFNFGGINYVFSMVGNPLESSEDKLELFVPAMIASVAPNMLSPIPFLLKQWTVYQNIRDYWLMHPVDWSLKESAQIVTIRDKSNNALFKVNIFPNYDYEDNDTQKIREYVTSLETFTCNANSKGNCMEIEAAIKKSGGWQLQKSDERTIDNMRGIRYSYVKGRGDYTYLYYVSKQGVIYEFDLELTNVANVNPPLGPVLQRILETFKFPK